MGYRNTISESSIEQKFVRLCKRHGMRVIKMSTQFEMGLPDRLVLFHGFAGFCELKAPGKKPSLCQEVYLRKLAKEGNFVGVVDHPNDVVTWIANFEKHVLERVLNEKQHEETR